MGDAMQDKEVWYQCPCGYRYFPEQGDDDGGYAPGTPFEELPDALTCPHCQTAKTHFRKKTAAARNTV